MTLSLPLMVSRAGAVSGDSPAERQTHDLRLAVARRLTSRGPPRDACFFERVPTYNPHTWSHQIYPFASAIEESDYG